MNDIKNQMYLQLHINKAEKMNQHLYKWLLTQKLNGFNLDFTEVSRETLSILYLEEGLVDKQIASLYEVNWGFVRSKRVKLGIKKQEESLLTICN